MSRPIIEVQNLSKKYRLGQLGARTLREEAELLVNRFWKRNGRAPDATKNNGQGTKNGSESDFWALRDVSFSVQSGEVLGIIGRNGAGKSTLLKILSRITEPTGGEAIIRGRVASLLEVGTGFHPELSGRENIYLNGAILGMKKAEIDRKFDEIVAFAEVEQFLDTPVKRYSSGMYVRLAFAVAAHLEPEVLVIDEVLAVGDTEFQKKCIGKMENVAAEGKTVIVVSHSMSTVKALCSSALFLNSGRVVMRGATNEVVAEYLISHEVDGPEREISDEDHRTGVRQMRITKVRLLNGVLDRFAVYWKQPIMISFEIEVRERLDDVAVGAQICSPDGTPIFTVHHDDDHKLPLWSFTPGLYQLRFTVVNPLRPGVYKLELGADHQHLMLKNYCVVCAATLEVLDHTEHGVTPMASQPGFVSATSNWEHPKLLDSVQCSGSENSAHPERV